jgi:predicted MFS family arabinose efflux permease
MRLRSFFAWHLLCLFVLLVFFAWLAQPLLAATAPAPVAIDALLSSVAGAATDTEPGAATADQSAGQSADTAATAKDLAMDLATDVGAAALKSAASGGGLNPYYLLAVALGTLGGWVRTWLRARKKDQQVASALESLKAGSRAGFAAADCLLDDRPGDPAEAADAFADVVMVSREQLAKLKED